MEGSDGRRKNDGGGSTAVGPRWNPTKEQVSILEGMYREGVRTPTAEQIQEITGRLRVYGHIEGKNVFYWFQNHKARLRQKQKQERMAYLNRYFHHHTHAPPHLPPPPPLLPFQNVICGPYYPHHRDPTFYSQYLNCGIKRRNIISDKFDKSADADPATRVSNAVMNGDGQSEGKTLNLFPLHPTGILEGNKRGSSSGESSNSSSDTTTNDGTAQGGGDGGRIY
ncbi:hypothetical protein Nepgr_014601 [Nepenthes gracilis]|uniref:Homeobox domain-containing protein n=1 Tax=Nepenthes gracilis TaxID=150966 RepID=A0AAD3SL60_NEPGR|nr:hypothetical protein Nepgr_014601 [Nepenthes gracilis]